MASDKARDSRQTFKRLGKRFMKLGQAMQDPDVTIRKLAKYAYKCGISLRFGFRPQGDSPPAQPQEEQTAQVTQPEQVADTAADMSLEQCETELQQFREEVQTAKAIKDRFMASCAKLTVGVPHEFAYLVTNKLREEMAGHRYTLVLNSDATTCSAILDAVRAYRQELLQRIAEYTTRNTDKSVTTPKDDLIALLASRLQWYVDNDDTNDTDDNAHWLEHKQAAIAALTCVSKQ